MKKPIIGIVGRAIEDTNGKKAILCYESMSRSINRNGGQAILLLPNQDLEYSTSVPNEIQRLTSSEKEDLKRLVDICDGIVMPGGNKLFEYDQFIYEYAKEKDMPILGICAGMQLICLNELNELYGKEKVLRKVNEDNTHQVKEERYVHKIILEDNNILMYILGKKEFMVNSKHTYCVDKIGNLKLLAKSEDGIIEAVQVKNKKFIVGLQWHPESMFLYDNLQYKIFEYFVKLCK